MLHHPLLSCAKRLRLFLGIGLRRGERRYNNGRTAANTRFTSSSVV